MIADVSNCAATALTAGINQAYSRVSITLTAKYLAMTLGTILVIILILVLIGAIPNWGYSRGWGYGPSGIVGVVLVVVLVLLLMGRI